MKWSALLPTASIGTRCTALHATPSLDVLSTMSFAVHPGSKRQSSHATNTRPAASTSAVGSGLVRRSPATEWKLIRETVLARDHVWPPSVDRNAAMLPVTVSNGTTTVPFGCTTGWPPSPLGLPAG